MVLLGKQGRMREVASTAVHAAVPQSPRATYAMRQAKVEVRERPDGMVQFLYKYKPLEYSIYREPPRQAELIPAKELNAALDVQRRRPKKRKVHVPAPEHPWRKLKVGKANLK